MFNPNIFVKLDEVGRKIIEAIYSLIPEDQKIQRALSELLENSRKQTELALLTLDRERANGVLLEKLLARMTPPPAVRIQFDVYDEAGTLLEKDVTQMILNRHTFRRIVCTPKDEDGNPTQLDGKPAITSNNAAATIGNVSDDGFSFDLTAGGLAGSGPISLEGDADLDPVSVRQIIGTLDVTVPAGNAVNIDFQVGDEQPVIPPG